MLIIIPCSHKQDVCSCSHYEVTGHLKKLSVTLTDALNTHHTCELNCHSSWTYLHLLASLFWFNRKVEEKRKQGISLGEQPELSSKPAAQQLSQHLQQLSCFSCQARLTQSALPARAGPCWARSAPHSAPAGSSRAAATYPRDPGRKSRGKEKELFVLRLLSHALRQQANWS